MTDLEKFQAVNKCETIKELEALIMNFADEDGFIRGRTRFFNASQMASYVDKIVNDNYPPNLLTREFGIRQQALYLRYYNND